MVMRNAMILNSNYARMAIVCVLAASALYGEAAANEFSEFVWTDEPVSIDTSAQDRIVPSSVAIAYDHAWFNLADGVQLRLESAPDAVDGAVYETVATFSDGAGTYDWAIDTSVGYCRKIRLMAVADNEAATELAAATVAVTMANGESGATELDTKADKLQRAADECRTVNIVYDSEWFGNIPGMELKLGYVCTRPALGPSVKNVILGEFVAPAAGVISQRPSTAYGEYDWSLTASVGNEIIGSLHANYVSSKLGFIITIR